MTESVKYIKKFEEITHNDVLLVGGKNASLGQMIRHLSDKNILIPTGFAITSEGYWYFLRSNKLVEKLQQTMNQLTDVSDIETLKKVGSKMREIIQSGTFPNDLKDEILQGYKELCQHYKEDNLDVAVRSSATAEDLPEASFAGQQETYLNIKGDEQLLNSCKACFASLFTDRAIVYRVEKGFDHFSVALSVGVQKMVRADVASAGVIFTLDTETGFPDVIVINSSFGLGEVVVKGIVTPDEFILHKPTVRKGYSSIIKKYLGKKDKKIIYAQDSATKEVSVGKKEQQVFSLHDEEILFLGRASITIEDYYSQLYGKWMPMDIEWAKDGIDGKLYIVQARPETVHAPRQQLKHFQRYHLEIDDQQVVSRIIVTGQSIGQQIATGKVRIISSIGDVQEFNEGDILVTGMTDPDWVPIMKRAAAIVTDRGGRTCHAAIVSRELGVPAVIGAVGVSEKLKNGQEVTVDCSKGNTGYIYDGILDYTIKKIDIGKLPKLSVAVMVNLSDPDRVFSLSFLPVDGVGLARIEFIISNIIKIHPMVAVRPDMVKNKNVLDAIYNLAGAYESIYDYFLSLLSQAIGTIAAGFYPRPVIVRFSDFKSNEYANLLGGSFFEPEESNPMLGLRGASRYYSALYQEAFILECKAMKRARDEMGLHNIQIMVPFVRTVTEAQQVINIMKEHGLEQGKNGLKIIMMCEIPSNVILIDKFSSLFDGFSIGSNDLTQMILGVDRDSELLAPLFDERDEAVKIFMSQAISGAKKNNRSIGICGQAPSDYPEIAEFLIEQGIDSLSLNPDTVLPFLMRYKNY